MRFCRYLSLIAVTLIITGCAIQPLPKDPSAVVWDKNNNRWVTPEAMTTELSKVKYVVIGEMYQSFTMRDQLLNSLDSLKHDGWLKVLVLDALKPEVATEGQSYIQQLDSAPSFLADRYRPFVIWADQQDDVVLLGAATPKEKLSSLKNPEGRKWLAEQTRDVLPEEKQKYLREVLTVSHPGSNTDDNANEYLLSAQQLHDYFMARMVTSTRQNTVLITRAFHARKDLGVEPYIKNWNPEQKFLPF